MNYQIIKYLVSKMLSKLLNNNWSKPKTAAAASKHGIIHTAASCEACGLIGCLCILQFQ